jgi:hypothetical protein
MEKENILTKAMNLMRFLADSKIGGLVVLFAAVPRAVGGCWAVVAEAGDGVGLLWPGRL